MRYSGELLFLRRVYKSVEEYIVVFFYYVGKDRNGGINTSRSFQRNVVFKFMREFNVQQIFDTLNKYKNIFNFKYTNKFTIIHSSFNKFLFMFLKYRYDYLFNVNKFKNNIA